MSIHVTKRDIIRGIGLGGLGMIAASAPAWAIGGGHERDRIARVRAWPLLVPCRIEVGSYASDLRMGGTIVEIETQDGLTGFGFTSISKSQVVAAAVNLVAGPEIIGQDALARSAVAEQLYHLLTPRAQMGDAQHAMSAIDIALWDILGKRLNMPIWRLLGGARSSVKSYTTFGMGFMSADELAAVARHLSRNGHKRLKMVVAYNIHSRIRNGETLEAILAEDARRIRGVRDAIGPDIDLYIDANHGLDEFEARRFIGRIADYDIAFFEEPLSGNDPRRLADLRRHSAIPITAGQNETHISRFRDFAIHDSVDMIQFNTCYCGGYTEALKVAALARSFAMPIDNGGGYAEYNMHLHAGAANGGAVEWHLGSVALGQVLYDRLPDFQGDRLQLPETPGLGFSLNRELLDEFAMEQ